MPAYYDTGVLVALYVEEVLSATVDALVAQRGEHVPFNGLQRAEMENAFRLKAFRKAVEAGELERLLAAVQEDLDLGRLQPRPVAWPEALETTRVLSRASAVTTGCRTLDLLHVAVALQWACPVFVSSDGRQLLAAQQAGLETVDVQQLQ